MRSSERKHELRNKDCAHVTSEDLRNVVRFLRIKGHNRSEIYRDMCGVYGEDCMDRSNVSGWRAFYSEFTVRLGRR